MDADRRIFIYSGHTAFLCLTVTVLKSYHEPGFIQLFSVDYGGGIRLKILHIGLASHYTENMTYQDNMLSDQNAADGHETTYVSDTLCYIDGELRDVGEEDKILPNGVHLIRVKYDAYPIPVLTTHVRRCRKIRTIIDNTAPDVILYHGLVGYELITVSEYKRAHPNVRFYADCHADYNNTGRTRLSLLWHKTVNRFFVQKAIPYIDKILNLTYETKAFAIETNNISEEKFEWYPLGGTLLSRQERMAKREAILAELGIDPDNIILTHSGKLDPLKKTKELLNAFASIDNSKVTLLICGSFDQSNEDELRHLIDKDPRVRYLGWKTSDELIDILAATDLYCQPGSQSATMQNAICCGCAILLFPHVSYRDYTNGNVFWAEDEEQIREALVKAISDKEALNGMKEKSLEFAAQHLDYKKLAQRLYQ